MKLKQIERRRVPKRILFEQLQVDATHYVAEESVLFSPHYWVAIQDEARLELVFHLGRSPIPQILYQDINSFSESDTQFQLRSRFGTLWIDREKQTGGDIAPCKDSYINRTISFAS